MKRLIFFLGLFLLFSQLKIYAQMNEPVALVDTVIFNSHTGNFILKFQYPGSDYIFEEIYEPPTKINTDVNCVTNKSENIFIFKYIIKNDNNSIQRLSDFLLDYQSDIHNIKSPNYEWLPLLFSYRKTISWGHCKSPYGALTKYDGIAPDSLQDGFQYESKGLPGIFTAYFRGVTKPLGFPDEPPEKIEAFINSIDRFPANTVQRKTLGPKDPPSPFISAVFLDTLLSYNSQSFDLGWIKDTGTRDRYGNYLTTAKSALAQGRISSCREELGNLLRDVAQDSAIALTSEAYSLLRYNTEYLLEQLPQGEVTINDLIAYIQDASQTGKIDNKGVANSLISKLETAQKQIDKDKTKQAVNALGAFLSELEAQKEKHVNLDVYNYLKEKVEALIEQISVG